jgi:dephospho-CoA kinase
MPWCIGHDLIILSFSFGWLPTSEADKLAHDVYQDNSPVLQELANAFGSHLITEDGNLNRAELGKVVFDNLEALQQLEQIVWPHVENLVHTQIQGLKDTYNPTSSKRPIIVVEAAVLLDAGWYNFQDGVWVVQASPEVALSRLQEFRNMSREEALQRIEAQKSRRGMANLQDELDAGVVSSVVDNSGDVEALRQVIGEKLQDDTAWFPSNGK